MTTATAAMHEYAAAFSAWEKRLPGESLRPLRRAALERFRALGFPTTAHPDWKGTDVSAVSRAAFEPADATAPTGDLDVEALTFDDERAFRIALVDGRFEPALSSRKWPATVSTYSLAALAEQGALPKRGLELARHEENAFTALNLAYFRDGVFVDVAPAANVELPIHIVHLASQPDRAIHARTIVRIGARAQAKIVESYAGPVGARYFTNAVTEVLVGEDANLDHARLQRESEAAYHVATTQVVQAARSTYRSNSIAFGALLSRHELDARFEGEGAEGTLDGLFVPAGRQHVDTHTWLDHAKPHCSSRELYKGVLDGKSRGIFNGRIVVRKDAQKTDAKQTNKNLLLSREALVDSNPQLEIYADDVKCTHGSTIGQLEEEQVFYVRSRGIPLPEARALLTHAFAREVVDRLKVDALRDRVDSLLRERLAQGSKVW